MNITNTQQEHLYKAFGLFIEAFRFYVVEVLSHEFEDKWSDAFVDALYPAQRESWNLGINSGSSPDALVDFQYLKPFALRYRDLLKQDFGRDTSKLATRLETIQDTRNKLAHFQDITSDEFTETFIQMKNIARALNMDELEQELHGLQHNEEKKSKAVEKPATVSTGSVAPWFMTVRPHADIRQGRLDESVFAANIAEVALNNGREVYNNHVVFFEKTYFTAGLKNVAKTVIKGLNGTEDAENRVISLQTGFGGGKTHTLISLYHIARHGKLLAQSSHAADLLEYTGIPQFENANIAVFTNTTNDPANGRKVAEGDLTINTIWGEIAYQLGGKECYDIVRKNDEQLIAPGGLFKQVLAHAKPALILIDELADYCVKAAARKAGNSSLADQTISFMQELTEAVAGTENCVAVITLPASPQEVGNTPEAQAILSSLQKRVSRVGADTQPVANDEIYEVIRRRLFENIGDSQTVEAVVSKYMDMYQQYGTELPPNANKGEYKQRLLKSYPFHPELIDVFRVRWASNSDFQRTRGVLRLLAAIVSDLWKRQQSLPGSNLLIQSGQISFANLDALSGQLKKLYGNGYDAVISADVAGSSSNAFKIDGNKTDYGQWYLTQSIASVILQNSFGSEGSNKGISVAELKLNLLVPNGFNHNSINGALDELENKAYYLYYAQTGGNGKRYWFHTKPNINILINQAKSDVKTIDIDAEIIRMVKQRTANRIELFNVIVDPTTDIPEQMRPTLVILSPKHLSNGGLHRDTEKFIAQIATKKGNSERVYRNTMLYLVATEIGISKLQSTIREYLACTKIHQDYGAQLEPEQKTDLRKRMEDAQKQSEASLAAAYSNAIKYGTKQGVEILAIKQFKDSLDIQINNHIIGTLKDEEWLLENVGLGTLRSNNLLPTVDSAIKVKDVYEAFIRFDDKPMIVGREAVARSLQKYCTHGELAIASGDGNSFTRVYYQENVPFLDVEDASLWLMDKSLAVKNDQPESAPGIYPSTGTGHVVREKPDDSVPTVVTDHTDQPVKQLKSIKIAGNVPLNNYTELFNYFIAPFAMNGNKVEIDVTFKIKSTASNPLTENMIQYKSAREAATQLGLDFEEDK